MFATSPSWSMHGKRTRFDNLGTVSKKDLTPAPTGYHPEKWSQSKTPSWKYKNYNAELVTIPAINKIKSLAQVQASIILQKHK